MPAARSALAQLVKSGSAVADALRPSRPGVAILIYHRVGAGSGLEVDLPTSLFEAQMAMLAGEHEVVSLGVALERLSGPEPPRAHDPRRPPVVITFDDGTADFVDVALPILERHRLPVTLYAATGFIEDGTPFPDDGRPVSWSALADACSSGLLDVGSHTHGHRLLDRLSEAEVAAELDRSIALIGDRLGQAPVDFAYPKAIPGSPAAERAVRARFRSAALAGTRSNPYGRTDLYRLSRSPIQVGDGTRWFARKAAGGMGLEDDLRRVLNKRRYANATT